MNHARKLVTTLLITVLLFLSLNVAFGAEESFLSDIEGTWAESQISDWVGKGYVTGYEDGSFKPNNTITRAEFIALINRSYGFTETADVFFSDVASSSWIYTEVSKAIKAGYIKGYANGTFGANKPISRQEAAVIVDRLLSLTKTDSAAASFTDSSSIASWAKEAVDAAVANGILQGYANGANFKPNQPLTRAEAVVVLYRSVTVKESLEEGVPTPTTAPTAITAPTTAPTPTAPTAPTPTATSDTTAPVLSGVTTGEISIGDDVFAASNESGYLYLVPATTATTLTDLNQAVDSSIAIRVSVGAAVNSRITTVGLTVGNYVVYAVDSSNNISAASAEIVINKKQLTIANPSTLVADKMYDGMTSASVIASSLSGVVGDDVVTVTAVATYNDAAVGTDKSITVVYTLGGSNAGHYIAPVNYTITTGVITKAQLTIEDPELSLVESIERNSVIVVTKGALDGVVAGEDVTVTVEAIYDTTDTAEARALTVSYTLSGADEANYLAPINNTNYMVYVQYHVDLGTILDLITNYKVYDGTTTAAVLAGSRVGPPLNEDGDCVGEGICVVDDATVHASGTYNDKNVGTNKAITVSYSLTGVDATNYLPPINITVNTGVIAARQLSIVPPVLPLKVYDGNTTANLVPGTITGLVSGDEVFVQALATYENAEVGINKQVTIVYTLTGKDAGNYIAPASQTVSSGVIIAIP
ncbi:hypothetical protein BK133_04450 [Paenibacillus sp. FSL H8-0548]|uniref:YDG domain-containing protein n=1 Tax=Paenibacillus sp. FSL H8-0548 TaxID=1920422 RepID=UPI000970173C|nr:YDG domain-containing protein [Paenibacillus sp. FSL H8-0548]OMF37787.1 hypothetical protein BK133_04450 [Paenibacillus sp. FSL H8-0548]